MSNSGKDKMEARVIRILKEVTRTEDQEFLVPTDPVQKRGFDAMCSVVNNAVLEEHDSTRGIIKIITAMLETGKPRIVDGEIYAVVPDKIWRFTNDAVTEFIKKKIEELR